MLDHRRFELFSHNLVIPEVHICVIIAVYPSHTVLNIYQYQPPTDLESVQVLELVHHQPPSCVTIENDPH